MRVYHTIKTPQRRRGWLGIKPGWILLLIGLGVFNIYLLFIKGLPGLAGNKAAHSGTHDVTTARDLRNTRSSKVVFESSMGEVRGVSGIRDQGAIVSTPRPHRSRLRFDLEEGREIAGLRSLDQWCERTRGSIENGDTLVTALERSGLDGTRAFGLIHALKGVFDFRRCRPGDHFEILRSPNGGVERFVYHQSALVAYRVERRNGRLVSRREEKKAIVKVSPVSVRIEGSLYASIGRAGESLSLVMDLVDIFAWDIDFYTDCRPGDIVRILVEKIEVGGKFVRYGNILAAEYDGEIGVKRAFRYKTASGRVGYYDESGDSLRKAFLKSPLKFTRISSGFGMRVHPILGFSKKHYGVDLAAPRGTPIWAPADGTVTFAGRQGISGKLIKLRHVNGYQTIFAHLNKIAHDVRMGVRVSQKQVIGTVGSTGRTTGPHLHYGMKKNGAYINPFTQKFPPASPVSKKELSTYLRAISGLLDRLEKIPRPSATKTAAVPVKARDAG